MPSRRSLKTSRDRISFCCEEKGHYTKVSASRKALLVLPVIRRRHPPPRLLVSVRSVEEARAAFRGGASILDLKEPGRGALGRAAAPVVKGVAALLSSPPKDAATPQGSVTLSAALGEVLEEDFPPRWRPVPGVSFYKLGLSRCAGDRRWERLLDGWLEWLRHWSPGVALVAVAYTDSAAAQSPPPRQVLDYAIARRLPYFLVDTFQKREGSLRTWCSDEELMDIVEVARRGGVRVALAGSLKLEDFEDLVPLGPDVLAVRGAACTGGDRLGAVDPIRVATLVARLGGISRASRSRRRTPHPSS